MSGDPSTTVSAPVWACAIHRSPRQRDAKTPLLLGTRVAVVDAADPRLGVHVEHAVPDLGW